MRQDQSMKRFADRIEMEKRWRFDDITRLICTDCKLIFTWIPKNAGASIFTGLRAAHSEHKAAAVRVPYNHLRVINPEIEHYFHFAVSRNVWDRVVSCYFNKIAIETPSTPGILNRRPGLSAGMPFHKFVEWLGTEEGSDDVADQHWATQRNFTHQPDGEPIANHIVKYENLHDELQAIADRTGLDPSTLPHRNSRRKIAKFYSLYKYDANPKHYRKYYTDKRLVDLVGERYSRDIELFGHTF